MSASDKSTSALESVAALLREEIDRFERLTEQATRGALHSQKAIDRGIELVNEAAASHARFGEHLRALIDAVTDARDRQRVSAERLNERTQTLIARRDSYAQVRARFEQLGDEARAINALVLELAALAQGTQGAQGEPGSVHTTLDEVLARMEAVHAQAREIASQARGEQMSDLEREADALAQRVASTKNKLELLRAPLEAQRTIN